MMTLKKRYEGALIGLAVGDAVGTTVEFQAPGSFPPVTEMRGGGPFHLQAGEWTDDTAMALCLADSLVKCGGFNARDQMERYVRWWKDGYLSSNGRCFDIGHTVESALSTFIHTGEPIAGSAERYAAGNGSLMRLAPVPLYFSADPARAIALSGESSKTTHGAKTCVDACRYFGALLLGAVRGRPKEEILAARYAPVPDIWDRTPLCSEIDAVACGSFKDKNPPEIVGSGYVVAALEAALWAFFRSADFREGCLLAVNLGNDADTTAAIYGQLAGAYYGVSAIPERWRRQLAHLALITRLAHGLCAGSAA
jgi:ADP-ribosylglycohydrolase